MNNIISKIARVLAAPVREWPGLVAAMTVILAAVPLTMEIALPHEMKKLSLLALCQGFIYAWLLVYITVWAGRRWVAVALGSVVALWTWLWCQSLFFAGRPMSPEILLVVIETDTREAGSFLNASLSAKALLLPLAQLAVFGVLLWTGIRYNDAIRLWFMHRRPARVCVWVVAALMWIVGLTHISYLYSHFMTADIQRFEDWSTKQNRIVPGLFNMEVSSVSDGVTSTLFAFHGVKINTSEIPLWEETQREVLAETVPHSAEADSVNIVVIIGESFIRHHSPLYGYPLRSTPRMSAEADSGRLVAMTDYISPANLTSSAVRNFLNLNSLGDDERWSSSPFFPLVASRGGWQVRLFDNQVTTPKYLVDVQLSALMRNRVLTENCYSLANDTVFAYDGDFLDMVDSIAPADNKVGRMDIYHLYGQHFHPADRYPADAGWDYFTADSIPFERPWLTPEKRQLIAEYDNATRYNDYVVGRIIDRYAATPTIFLYFSDHGEEMYDASDCAVRNEPSGDLAGWLRRQFDIPFFVIANDRYLSLRPERWEAIRYAADHPGMLDNVGQAVLGLAGVRSRYYNARRDIFSPSYVCPPRRIVTRRLLYDSITRTEPLNR